MRHDSHSHAQIAAELDAVRGRLAGAQASDDRQLESRLAGDVAALEYELACARVLAARGLAIEVSLLVLPPCAGVCPWSGLRGRLLQVSGDGSDYLLSMPDRSRVWLSAGRCVVA